MQNSWANPGIQVLFYTGVVRQGCISHAYSACNAEACLVCQAGLLFVMLGQSGGKNCQASNFLREFSVTPQAIALGLVDSAPTPRTVLVQNFMRFMFEQVAVKVAIDGIGSVRVSVCESGHVQTRPVTSFVVEYSSGPFVAGVCAGISNRVRNKGWCSDCATYTAMTQHTQCEQLPSVLNVLVAAWPFASIPDSLALSLVDGQVTEGNVVFDLSAIIVAVDSGDHCVAVVRIGSEWVVFNDFLVRVVSSTEALSTRKSKVCSV